MFRRKFLIIIIFLLGILFSLSGCGNKEKNQKPINIILIVIDALRADHISSYNYFRKTTPNIDSLSQNSILCLNAFSQSNWTCPSMASIFSGTYALVHKVYNAPAEIKTRYSILPEKLTIISEALKKSKFYTATVTSCGWVSANSNYDQGFDEFKLLERKDKVIIENAISIIKKRKRKKFFLYLHLLDLHDYFWNKGDQGKFIKSSYNLSKEMKRLLLKEPDEISRKLKKKNEIPLEDLDYLIDKYDSILYRSDQLLGKLIKFLRDKKILNKTVIIITADHGEKFFEHNELLHGGRTLYNEVVHIPLIIHNKLLFPEQKKIEELIESIDIFPTLLDLFNVDEIKIDNIRQLQGNSILRYDENKTVLIENSKRDRFKIIHNNWSYIYHNLDKKGELFDLDKDPLEKNNIADENIIVTKKMHSLLTEKINDSQLLSQKILAEDAKIDENVKKALKSLGYIK